MYLIGVGSVKQKGYLGDRIVAKIGVGCDRYSLKGAKEWTRDQRNRNRPPLEDYLLRRENLLTPYAIANPLRVAVMIRFEENFPTRDFVKLFEAPLLSSSSCSRESWTTFRDTLSDSMGDRRMLAGDEVGLFWYDNGDLLLTKNHNIQGVLHLPEINRPLLAAFLDSQDGFAKDLAECVESSVELIDAD